MNASASGGGMKPRPEALAGGFFFPQRGAEGGARIRSISANLPHVGDEHGPSPALIAGACPATSSARFGSNGGGGEPGTEWGGGGGARRLSGETERRESLSHHKGSGQSPRNASVCRFASE